MEHSQKYRAFIAELVWGCGYRRVLELGTQHFACTLAIMERNPDASIDCVDLLREEHIPGGVVFHEMSTAAFFEDNVRSFDFIFIDADHAASAMMADLEGALEILAPGGTIAIHDTDPAEERFAGPLECRDSYRNVDWIESNYSAVTIPMDQSGLTLVRHRGDRRVCKWSKG